MKITDYYDKLSDDAKLIADFDLNKDHGEDCWNNLCQFVHDRTAGGWASVDEIVGLFDALEEVTLLEMEKQGIDVRNKKGKLVSGRVCKASTYRSAKSVIIRACRSGIGFMDHDAGKPLGKTAIEKRIKALSTPKEVDVDYYLNKFASLSRSARKNLSEHDYKSLLDELYSWVVQA